MTQLRPEATRPTTTAPSTDTPVHTRRRVLCGLSLALLAPTVIAACGSDDDDTSSDSPTAGGTTTPSPTTGTAAPSASGLVALADVPVGGGTIVDGPDGPVLVVQPAAGQVKAFTAICTHEGTELPAPEDGVVTCPKHFSEFDPATGAVLRGPAMDALSVVNVRLDGDQVVLA